MNWKPSGDLHDVEVGRLLQVLHVLIRRRTNQHIGVTGLDVGELHVFVGERQ